MLAVQLAGCTSLEMVLNKLNDYLDANPHIMPDSGLWLTGMGWDQNLWTPAVFPSLTDLDAHPRLSKIPIILTRIDAHAVWVNGRALELAMKYIPTEDSSGGKILRDARGNPTGVFVDDAIKYIASAMPPPTDDERFRALDAVTKEMLSKGLVGLHDAGVSMAEIEFFKRYFS